MKQIFIITILLTLSSCLVSQKTFDKKCCALEYYISTEEYEECSKIKNLIDRL